MVYDLAKAVNDHEIKWQAVVNTMKKKYPCYAKEMTKGVLQSKHKRLLFKRTEKWFMFV